MSVLAPTPWEQIDGGRYFPPLHEYQNDLKRVVPSVTQVLQGTLLVDYTDVPAYVLDRAADLGTAVHWACELLDRGELEGVSDRAAPYLLAYEKFKRERNFIPTVIEQRLIAQIEEGSFGMCVDRAGTVGEMPCVLDLKTSKTLQKACGIQLAAYQLGLKAQGMRAIVQLAADGSYKFIEYSDPKDFEVFRAALKVTHWKLSKGFKLK